MTGTTFDSKVLGAIMSAAVDAIIVSDETGTILEANASAHELFEYDAGDLVGINVRDLMPTPMADQHDGFMDNHIQTGVKKIIGIGRDVEGKRKTGEVFPLHLSVGATTVEDKQFFVAILHDRSRRVADEEALARTLRLDAVGRMTGGIAHDFNNFLTVIIGNLELAEMRSTDASLTRHIKNALEAAEIGADLTSRMMIFARRGKLQPEATDLGEVCNRMLHLVQRAVGENYTVTSDCPEGLSPILVDPAQLESAMINLALNARDAMPNGGHLLFQIEEIEIDDSYMAQETDVSPGHYVRILVSDDGDGMSLDTQKRAFEPFFTTKPQGKGTGLGLSMVHGFVRQSGGHITLYSEPGHGTSFGLYFPALRDAEDIHASGSDMPVLSDPPIGNAECVLVVEDNPKVLEISLNRLQSLNYKTRAAANASEAMAILKSDASIKILFSDIVMPGSMTGFDLAEWVSEHHPDIKILLTSGYASDIVFEKMQRSRKFDTLHKPYHQKDLAETLSSLLAGPTS